MLKMKRKYTGPPKPEGYNVRPPRQNDVPQIPPGNNDGLVNIEFKGATKQEADDFKAGYRKPRTPRQKEMDDMFEKEFKRVRNPADVKYPLKRGR